jgi:two-component system, OmpR family, KDP operon response regulator KdpE
MCYMLNVGRLILVVEDDPAMARFAVSALRLSGYQATVAATGAAGLIAFAAAPPDAMLVDIHLPDMSGWDLIEQVRSGDGSHACPVLVWTGHLDDADPQTEERIARVKRVLTKPVTASVLIDAVRDVAPLVD